MQGPFICRTGYWGFLIIIVEYIHPNPILIVKAPTVDGQNPA